MSRVCQILHTTFQYSYDAKYSFDDLSFLRTKKFLQSYSMIETVEDSTQLSIEQDGKSFILNGFELKTSEMRGSGKHRRRVVTNHDYLMKIVFPHARIPIQSDLFLVPDTHESKFVLFRSWGLFQKKRVVLENIDFEKIFDV